MGNLLFSPDGRINSAEFYRGGFVLILVMTALSMANLVNPILGQVAGLLSYLLVYPWVVIWAKRLHDGGKSGWMFLVYLLLYFILSTIGMMVVMMNYGGAEILQWFTKSVNGAITDAELQAKLQVWVRDITLPATISSILASLATMYIGDKTIPTDEGDNQYGPGYDYSTFD